MQVKTNMKAGGHQSNHNQSLLHNVKGLRVRSGVKAGGHQTNHNETVVRAVTQG